MNSVYIFEIKLKWLNYIWVTCIGYWAFVFTNVLRLITSKLTLRKVTSRQMTPNNPHFIPTLLTSMLLYISVQFNIDFSRGSCAHVAESTQQSIIISLLSLRSCHLFNRDPSPGRAPVLPASSIVNDSLTCGTLNYSMEYMHFESQANDSFIHSDKAHGAIKCIRLQLEERK